MGRCEAVGEERDRLSLKARVGTLLGAIVAVLALIVFVVAHFLLPVPATVSFTADHIQGHAVNMTIQADPVNDASSTPDWASYFVRDPHNGKWIRSTIWQLPAHTRINVTAYQYDSCGPLRNQYFGHVRGTVGSAIYVNGHSESLADSYRQCSVAHSFTVPQLGINVPLAGVPGSAKNPCAQAPCQLSDSHEVIKFSFVTPGPGEYRWQCFVPCGLASLDGNGHPMGTLGFMSGFLKVVTD
jgi:hypothetical protein